MAQRTETLFLNQHGQGVMSFKLPDLKNLNTNDSESLQEQLILMRLCQGCYAYKSVPDIWGFPHLPAAQAPRLLTVCNPEGSQPKYADHAIVQNWQENWQYVSAAEAQIGFLQQQYQTWQAQELLDVFGSVTEALYRRVQKSIKARHAYTRLNAGGAILDYAYFIWCNDGSTYWITSEHQASFQPPLWFQSPEKCKPEQVLSVDPETYLNVVPQ